MEQSYFMTQMAELLHAPIYIYQQKTEEIETFGLLADGWGIWKRDKELLRRALLIKNRDYPVISDVDNELVYGVIESSREETFLLGPVLLGRLTPEREMAIEKKYKLNMDKYKKLPVCPLGQFVSGVLLVYSFLTGKELTIGELWDKNKNTYENAFAIQKRMSQDLFWQQENVTRHHFYEQELWELESIENGDMEALGKSLSENQQGKLDFLTKDILRSCKNIVIGNITLASRAAIRGGLSVEKSLFMADSLIRQVEEIDNIFETEVFKREAQYAYAKAVEEGKKLERQKEKKNPLVQQVKEYIFRNLHSPMRVIDIAESFHVNADYLSHLFSSEEHETLTRYILREKIKRGENLLKYSDYRIQEIGFYLGFSSQSHFTKRFQEILGMSPNEYRKKYGNRKKWK